MVIALVLLLVIAAARIDWVWLPMAFCAMAAMHWAASFHLADPLAPLYVFLVGGFLTRFLFELALVWIRRRV